MYIDIEHGKKRFHECFGFTKERTTQIRKIVFESYMESDLMSETADTILNNEAFLTDAERVYAMFVYGELNHMVKSMSSNPAEMLGSLLGILKKGED